MSTTLALPKGSVYFDGEHFSLASISLEESKVYVDRVPENSQTHFLVLVDQSAPPMVDSMIKLVVLLVVETTTQAPFSLRRWKLFRSTC